MVHQCRYRVARFTKAQQQKQQLVRSTGARAAHTPTTSSAHTQTAGRGRRHRRRPTKDAAAPASQEANSPGNARRCGYRLSLSSSSYHLHHHQHQTNIIIERRGASLPSFIRLYWAPQQTRWRGGSVPVSFDSTGHPNRRRRKTTSVESEGKRRASHRRAAMGGPFLITTGSSAESTGLAEQTSLGTGLRGDPRNPGGSLGRIACRQTSSPCP